MPPPLLAPLSASQRDTLEELQQLALHFNRRLNLYSESSAAHFWQRHIAHSLALASRPFPAGAEVVDWGTGGGMPGLPLAIVFPETTFHLVDAVGKKVRTVEAMVRRLGLSNVNPWHGRAEQWEGEAHYSVSRATSPLTHLWTWHRRVAVPIGTAPAPDCWTPGLLCLKGGDLGDEEAELAAAYPALTVCHYDLRPLLAEAYFEDKVIVSVNEDRTR